MRERLDLSSKGAIYAVIWGLASALLLYGVFFAGNLLSRRLFPFAAGELHSIYDLKSNTHPVALCFVLLLIGGGEEIFWRGFLQHHLSRRFSFLGVFLVTALYTIAHITTLNIMLMLAALVAGLFWGFLYELHKNIWLNVISHISWDIAVFVFFPF